MRLNLHVLCLYYLLILAFTLGRRLLLLSHKPGYTNAANLIEGCGHAKFSTLRNGMDSFRVVLCLDLGKCGNYCIVGPKFWLIKVTYQPSWRLFNIRLLLFSLLSPLHFIPLNDVVEEVIDPTELCSFPRLWWRSRHTWQCSSHLEYQK